MSYDRQKIAIELCRIRGINPYKYVSIPCPDAIPGCCVAHFGPAWRSCVMEIDRHLELIQAIEESKNAS